MCAAGFLTSCKPLLSVFFMCALVHWESDNYLSMINVEAVIEGEVSVGEIVKANYMKKPTAQSFWN